MTTETSELDLRLQKIEHAAKRRQQGGYRRLAITYSLCRVAADIGTEQKRMIYGSSI